MTDVTLKGKRKVSARLPCRIKILCFLNDHTNYRPAAWTVNRKSIRKLFRNSIGQLSWTDGWNILHDLLSSISNKLINMKCWYYCPETNYATNSIVLKIFCQYPILCRVMSVLQHSLLFTACQKSQNRYHTW